MDRRMLRTGHANADDGRRGRLLGDGGVCHDDYLVDRGGGGDIEIFLGGTGNIERYQEIPWGIEGEIS